MNIDRLSPRELQVLERVAEGLPDKSIAKRLHISKRTVHAHLQPIFRKLNCSNRTQATRTFLEDRRMT